LSFINKYLQKILDLQFKLESDFKFNIWPNEES
jgi:hypothetical protein